MSTFHDEVESLRRYCDELERDKDKPGFFSTQPPEWLLSYKRNVIRWSACAPEGARLLPAPLQGWDGKPLGDRTPLGPQGTPSREVREIMAEAGRDWQFERRVAPEVVARTEALTGGGMDRSEASRAALLEVWGEDYVLRSEAYFAERRRAREEAA